MIVGNGVSIASVSAVELQENDVNFYDYDGTLLYSYFTSEFLRLTEFPSAPTHEGLTFIEWNWNDLESIKGYVTKFSTVDVGATYITNDGTTRLYLRLEDDTPLDFVLYCSVNNGTLNILLNGQTLATQSSAGLGVFQIPFTVPRPDVFPCEVVIKLEMVGTNALLGQSHMNVFGYNAKQCESLLQIEFATNCGLQGNGASQCLNLKAVMLSANSTVYRQGSYSFQYCQNLHHITIPNGATTLSHVESLGRCGAKKILLPPTATTLGVRFLSNSAVKTAFIVPAVTSVEANAFYYCVGLKRAIITNGVSTMGTGVFEYCVNLSEVILEDGLPVLSSRMFEQCWLLNSIKMPSSVITIPDRLFNQCKNLYEIDMSDYESVPILNNSNALLDTPSSQIIYVKNQEMLIAFSSATNWSTYADRFQIKGA